MKKPIKYLIIALLVFSISKTGLSQCTNTDISTFAGTGGAGFSGDGGAAALAQIQFPNGIAVDGAGNIFIADAGNQLIRKVDAATGIISTIAGTGTAGFSGDGGLATAAQLDNPLEVAVDGAGNVYIAERVNARIRRVDAVTGNISTFAGTGAIGFSGDGGPATAAVFSNPNGVAVDGAGNVYIADQGNSRIRKVDIITNIITTFAGTGTSGFSGDGGPAINADLNGPPKLVIDAVGNVFIADQSNNRIRKVDATTGNISTIAGTGIAGFSGDGGAATAAELNTPIGVAVDATGNVYIAEFDNNRIRKVDATTGNISTIAGTGIAGFSGDGGPASAAQLNQPIGIDIDPAGNILIVDFSNHRIRKVTVESQPAITGRDTTLCAGQTVDLSTLINGTVLNIAEYGTVFGTYGASNSQTPTMTTTYFVRDSNTTTRCVDTAQIIVTVENQPLITARDTSVMLGQTVDLSTLLNQSVTGSLDYGTSFGTYGLINPISAQPIMYFIRDSVQNAVGCVDIAKVTITIPTVSIDIVDEDGDGNPDITDPCSCFDPENVIIALEGNNTNVKYFHDFVTITNGGIGQTWVLDIVNAGAVLNKNGSVMAINTPLTDLGGGVYRLDLWHQPDVGFDATFRRLSDNNTQTTGGNCNGQACLTIPTMSQWGLLIFGLLVLNLGLIGVFGMQEMG